MSKRSGLVLTLAIGVALVGFAGRAAAADEARAHSGVVVSVDPSARTMVVRELAEEGKPRTLAVRITAEARIVLSEPLPAAEIKDLERPYRDTAIAVADLRPGDYVVIRSTRAHGTEVASQVVVTLRQTP
jgi:hypothetical protein